MKALVVYESVWGNTRLVAEAIAAGLGQGTVAVSTAEATPERLVGVDVLVCGAPIQMFSLPGERARSSIRPEETPTPDLSAPTMRSWLEGLPRPATATARYAAFETKINWSPGSAAHAISNALRAAGYVQAIDDESFIVKGKTGPLREGELERARGWGALVAIASGLTRPLVEVGGG